jgi:hypothetical protein
MGAAGQTGQTRVRGKGWVTPGGVDLLLTHGGSGGGGGKGRSTSVNSSGSGLCTARFRCCLDAKRRVRVLGTAMVGGRVVHVEVLPHAVRTSPRRYAAIMKRCVFDARHALAAELRRYIARFPQGSVTWLHK